MFRLVLKCLAFSLSLVFGLIPTIAFCYFATAVDVPYSIILMILSVIPIFYAITSEIRSFLSLIVVPVLMFFVIDSADCSGETNCITIGLMRLAYPFGYFLFQILGVSFLCYFKKIYRENQQKKEII